MSKVRYLEDYTTGVFLRIDELFNKKNIETRIISYDEEIIKSCRHYDEVLMDDYCHFCGVKVNKKIIPQRTKKIEEDFYCNHPNLLSKNIENVAETGLIMFKDEQGNKISYNARFFSDNFDYQYYYNKSNVKYHILEDVWHDGQSGENITVTMDDCEYIFIILKNNQDKLINILETESISMFKTKYLNPNKSITGESVNDEWKDSENE
jgi:hypothetical protein